MNNNNHYRLPDTEEEVRMVEDAVALGQPSDVDIVSLRHDLTDAIYATDDSQALYSCWVFLKNQKLEADNSLVSSLPREALSACIEMALKDHEDGTTIPHASLMERIKKQRGWK